MTRRHDYGQRNYVAAAQQLADMQAAGAIRSGDCKTRDCKAKGDARKFNSTELSVFCSAVHAAGLA